MRPLPLARLLTLLAPLAAACGDAGDDSATSTYEDSDGDGYIDLLDCAPEDASIHPGAAEVCDDVDNDCDDAVDEDPSDAVDCYPDQDQDGYGDEDATATQRCACEADEVLDSTDCDDDEVYVNPGQSEVCDDELDNDCANGVDDDAASDAGVWYQDSDGDGYGDAEATTSSCVRPSGYVSNDDDCDDSDSAVAPDQDELCDGVDNDCDGQADDGSPGDAVGWHDDADGDGYGDPDAVRYACAQPSGTTSDASDCDDTDAAISPAAAETCDGVDNNCDGDTDEDLKTTWYRDKDGDGYGDEDVHKSSCPDAEPTGYVADATDCDDKDAAINPGASEVCDGDDNDCDGDEDEDDAADAETWYQDSDGDGYGDLAVASVSCQQPSGTVSEDDLIADGDDCDDTDDSVHPDRLELCDGVDQDCDGEIDEGLASDGDIYYIDADGDGYGVSTARTRACSTPSGYADNKSDCDDGDDHVSPGSDELCSDGVDNDCDGTIDEEDAATTTWYYDLDGDGYGDASGGVTTCEQPSGTLTDGSDCDDSSASTFPGAAELDSASDCMADADADGYGDSAASGLVIAGTDCDDSSDAIYPGDAVYEDPSLCTVDADGDGYGDATPSGAEDAGTDCDDSDASIFPGAAIYDSASLCTVDADGDGYGDDAPGGAIDAGTDCDDSDGDTFPGAAEQESATLCMADGDDDGFGDETPASGVAVGTDCDDEDADRNPEATEVCGDGEDDDCDGDLTAVWIRTDFDEDISDTFSLNGDASQDWDDDGDGTLYLTPLAAKQAGSAYVKELLTSTSWTAYFDIEISDIELSGDGLTFAFLQETDPTILGGTGGSLGLESANGYAIEFDVYQNADDPDDSHVALDYADSLDAVSVASVTDLSDGVTRSVEVTWDNGLIWVTLDGDLLFLSSVDADDVDQDTFLIGFTAGTGGRYCAHQVRSFNLTCE